jgi:hypothetical protein
MLQDSVNRKVTVAPYAFYMSSISGAAPVLTVGALSTITY